MTVSVDQKTQDDIASAAACGDKSRYEQMIEQGRTYDVKSGTKVKLIGYGDGAMGASVYHVRIEGGPSDGKDGWVPMEFMKK